MADARGSDRLGISPTFGPGPGPWLAHGSENETDGRVRDCGAAGMTAEERVQNSARKSLHPEENNSGKTGDREVKAKPTSTWGRR